MTPLASATPDPRIPQVTPTLPKAIRPKPAGDEREKPARSEFADKVERLTRNVLSEEVNTVAKSLVCGSAPTGGDLLQAAASGIKSDVEDELGVPDSGIASETGCPAPRRQPEKEPVLTAPKPRLPRPALKPLDRLRSPGEDLCSADASTMLGGDGIAAALDFACGRGIPYIPASGLPGDDDDDDDDKPSLEDLLAEPRNPLAGAPDLSDDDITALERGRP